MERAAIHEAVRLAKLELPADAEIEVVGNDPVLPSPFRLGEGAAVAHGLVGIAASDIWKHRTGRGQKVSVDLRHAAVSLRSPSFLKVDGVPARARTTEKPPPTTALFECGDGRWVHLQAHFPRLQEGVLALLGCENSAEAIARAVKRWRAADLEDALAERGLCGAMARSAEEWAAHPQGRALARLPVIEIERIGDADPVPFPEAGRPLDQVRVLDATRVLAGPTCARALAEHRADVLHIASPRLPTIESSEIDTGHGKRQAHLDFDRSDDVATLKSLISEADVFSQSYRSGSFMRRGLGPEDVAALSPGIIYVSINCYGHRGPWERRPGWEQLAQTVTGIATEQGSVDRPAVSPAAANDFTTGYLAAYGVMRALLNRAVEGGSWHVKASLCQTGMWFVRLGASCDPAEAEPLDDVSDYLQVSDSPYGRLEHLAPVVQMSETPPRWERPAVPLGSDAAEWLPR